MLCHHTFKGIKCAKMKIVKYSDYRVFLGFLLLLLHHHFLSFFCPPDSKLRAVSCALEKEKERQKIGQQLNCTE